MGFRAIKYRVYPTDAQCEKLGQTFGCVRKVYNDALSMQRGLYEAGMPTFGKTALNAYCNRVWKNEFPFLAEVDKFALTNSLYALCTAYKNFFEGRTGYPRYKSRRGEDKLHQRKYRSHSPERWSRFCQDSESREHPCFYPSCAKERLGAEGCYGVQTC